MGSRMILAAPLAALPFMPFPALAEGEAEGRTAEHRLESNERQQVSEALKAVEEAWEAVEAATADRWRSAKETFDQAVIDLEKTWDDVISDSERPDGPTSQGDD